LKKKFKIIKIFKFFLFLIFLNIIAEVILIFYDSKNDRKILKKSIFSKQLNIYNSGKTFAPNHGFYTYRKNLKNKQLLKILYNNDFISVINNYKFNTNNFGLVQNKDLEKNQKSYLILGSFFAEFLGYNNFDSELEKKIKDKQFINGGFQNAGFYQNVKFEKYISKYFEISKVIYIFESQDLYKYKLFKHDGDCIVKSTNCNINSEIGLIRKLNSQNYNFIHNEIKNKNLKFKNKDILKTTIKNTHIYNFLENFINKYRKKKSYIIEENLRSIEYLNNKYKKNIIFINIKNLNEIVYKKEKYNTKTINSFFNKKKIPNFTCEVSQSKKIIKDDYIFDKKFENEIKDCILSQL